MQKKRHTYQTGIIGNCGFIAHVHKDGSIPWLCWPKFDSSPVFGTMLDPDAGEFSIIPEEEILSTSQQYIQNTNILVTEFHTAAGKFRIIDFAPRFYSEETAQYPLVLCRKVELLEGNPRIRVNLSPKYDYGKEKPTVTNGLNFLSYKFHSLELKLYTNFSHNYLLNGKSEVLNETKYFYLACDSDLSHNLKETMESFYHRTKGYWQNWVKHCSLGNFAQNEVIRSALCLKIHQYQDTGAIIASSTTSLPESPGSGRNWDYRYCWIRDSYYTLNALTTLGHFEEMERFANYLANLKPNQEGRYQPLYTITGDSFIDEEILDLEGYKQNVPVRVGNQAYTHIQNDVYGQILLSLLPLYSDERILDKNRFQNLSQIRNILFQIKKTMNEPDAGLWEFRNLSQKHCYTFLFHWAGASAVIKIAESLGEKDLLKEAITLKEEAIKKIEECYHKEKSCYTQAEGTAHLDASLLQLVTMSYLDPTSPKAKDHIKAIEKNLKTEKGLLYRYKHKDDFGTPESTFLVCSFWYIECLACMNRLEEAEQLFHTTVNYSNHLGLFSEDIEAESNSMWGNFPQTYSHVGLVNAAYRISQKKGNPVFL
ncbi:glycoside hydrolase family 15 protein [Leptospira idonii]|uniref:Glycoside hydrolase family 15 protein n=1 Tax=Leptospira idonii TaxID=1193500 RepID=A0A4R9LWW1_9LEPT|nr:glycoside hydrolase family 15 protein [Leptospira idonii]TGN18132.1 glycoside hydrolase family 15 protein [Leptospira idonii]